MFVRSSFWVPTLWLLHIMYNESFMVINLCLQSYCFDELTYLLKSKYLNGMWLPVIRYLKCFFTHACAVCTVHPLKNTHTHRNIYKFVCKSENVFRKRTGNLINTVCGVSVGSKVPSGRRHSSYGPAGTSPPPLVGQFGQFAS